MIEKIEVRGKVEKLEKLKNLKVETESRKK